MTLSKERLEQYIRQPLENALTRSEIMQLAKMMLNQDDWNAAQQKVIDDLRVQLERRERDKQEPGAYRKLFTCSGCGAEGLDEPLESTCHCYENSAHWIEGKLYVAPPAPVFPDMVTAEDVRWMLKQTDHDDGPKCRIEHAEYIGAMMWNACRSAMLQSFGNSEQLNSPAVPDGWVMVPKRLTADNGAKAALIGEFNLEYSLTCHECFGEGCDDCSGEGSWTSTIPIDWTTIKDIWAKATDHFVAAPKQESE